MTALFATNKLVDELLRPQDIHETYRQRLTGIPLFLLVAGIVTVAHVLNLYYSIFHGKNLGQFMLVHLFISLAVYFYTLSQSRGGRDPRFGYLLLIMGLVIGPIGAVGTIYSALLVGFFSRYSLNFREWFASIFPKRAVPKVEQMYDDIILGRDEHGKRYSVQSFHDVMAVGSDAQKRTAIGRMTAAFRPEFAPAFRLALQDGSPTVRVQAATAIAKIENLFYERLVKLQTLVEHYPKRAEVKKALALHYDDYAFTGLLDPYREQQNRERAKAVYLAYLAQQPADILVRQNIGRLLVRGGQAEEAAEWLRNCIAEGHVNEAIKLWYFECLFNTRDYARLRDAVFSLPVDLASVEREKPELAAAMQMWQQARNLTQSSPFPPTHRAAEALESIA